MSRRVTTAVATAVTALVFSAVALAVSAPKLNGTVGPGFTISLKDSTGKAVKTLKAGNYTFVVNDRSGIHNFAVRRLKAKTRTAITTVPQTGMSKPKTITLGKGMWEFYCEPHEDNMRGTITVK